MNSLCPENLHVVECSSYRQLAWDGAASFQTETNVHAELLKQSSTAGPLNSDKQM